MAQGNRAVRGTADVLPGESEKWQYLEARLRETAALYGFREIRLPVFEHTEVFRRSVGDTTDVVQKEMYTFEDKGGRSVTLRPELTSGTVRSVIEQGLAGGMMPLKLYYIGGCYRYEKPQAGRMREFHQFGVECFGAAAPAADAEIIALAGQLLDALGIRARRLALNSIGCADCRAVYQKALVDYFAARSEQLCETCKDRLHRNPMRILDCKNEACAAVAAGAPMMLDHLCEPCGAHFAAVLAQLDAQGIAYEIDARIVRGLDYYTRTVFEFICEGIGAQSTICGGGRYDRLVEQMGGPALPALGFAMGMERLLLAMERLGCPFPQPQPCQVYIAPVGDAACAAAARLCGALRAEGFSAMIDLAGRSVKAQMKYADKIGARFTLVLGDEELTRGAGLLKNMATGAQTQAPLDSLAQTVYAQTMADAVDGLTKAAEQFGAREAGETK